VFSDESLSPPSILYVLANLVLNISAIRILKIGGAVEINLASMALVPINSLLFCLPIPLLGATPFSLYFVSGLAVVVGGTQSILCSVLPCPTWPGPPSPPHHFIHDPCSAKYNPVSPSSFHP
jgi:hypothetical protein